MPKAFVLVNVDPDAKNRVMEEVRDKSEASEVYNTSSNAYDMIVKFEADTKESLHEAVTSIRTIDGVKSTLTMDVVENSKKKSRPLQI